MGERKVLKDYGNYSEQTFEYYRKLLTEYLINAYNISVFESNKVDSEDYVGSYDGLSITIKSSLRNEHKLFLLAHLFGHLVQWCGSNADKYKSIEEVLATRDVVELRESQIEKLKDYEEEAASISLHLLCEVVGNELTQWFSDWSHADWEYLMKLMSPEKKDQSATLDLKFGTELIRPNANYYFSPKKITLKYAY